MKETQLGDWDWREEPLPQHRQGRFIRYDEVQEALKNNVWNGKVDWQGLLDELFPPLKK